VALLDCHVPFLDIDPDCWFCHATCPSQRHDLLALAGLANLSCGLGGFGLPKLLASTGSTQKSLSLAMAPSWTSPKAAT
jgi:hypothetical protein